MRHHGINPGKLHNAIEALLDGNHPDTLPESVEQYRDAPVVFYTVNGKVNVQPARYREGKEVTNGFRKPWERGRAPVPNAENYANHRAKNARTRTILRKATP